ncbi:hypothetical protein HMPREF1230_0020, partial [Streptococcus pyogenes GA19681]
MSWKTLALKLGNETTPSETVSLYDDSNQCLENEFLKVMIQTDGRLTITDKQSGVSYQDLLRFEDCGDIG